TSSINKYFPDAQNRYSAEGVYNIDISESRVNTSTENQSLATALDSRIIYADSITDMLALDTEALINRQRVSVRAYHSGTNVGGGTFYWDAESDDVNNGGTVFSVNGVVGRWK